MQFIRQKLKHPRKKPLERLEWILREFMFQSEVHSLRAENRSLRASGATPRVDPVREKAKYASEQINAAAKNAEQMLK